MNEKPDARAVSTVMRRGPPASSVVSRARAVAGDVEDDPLVVVDPAPQQRRGHRMGWARRADAGQQGIEQLGGDALAVDLARVGHHDHADTNPPPHATSPSTTTAAASPAPDTADHRRHAFAARASSSAAPPTVATVPAILSTPPAAHVVE
jgi:hypothetical protein